MTAQDGTRRRTAWRTPAPTVDFTLERRDGQRPRRRDDHPGRRPPRRRDPAALLQAGHATRSATAAPAWSRSRASACSRRRAAARRRAGMEVTTDSERARARRRRWCSSCCSSDMPETDYTRRQRARRLGGASSASASRASRRARSRARDLSHPAIAVNLDACIQCTRCVRACREEQVNDVIGYAFRGEHAKIVFDMDDPMGASTCVACGECVQACPTGALMPARDAALDGARQAGRLGVPVLRRRLPAHLQRQGQQDPPRRGPRRPGEPRAACASRAATASTTSHHPQRLTKPLIRRDGAPKRGRLHDGPGRRRSTCSAKRRGKKRSTLAGGTLTRDPRHATARRSLAGFGSAKGSNEEAYLFQKLVRTGFGSNNVDHCTRLCHASSVAALLEGIGSGAVSQPGDGRDCRPTSCSLIGANPTVEPPGRRDLDQERGEERHQADPRRSAPLASSRATRTATCSSSPTPTSRC